jgi:hypothetical protein
MRMRIILPKLWQSETFAGVSWDARFLLMGLWSYCDDEGRGLDKTALIASALFPFDLQSDPSETFRRTGSALDELAAAKLIWRYQVHDDKYLQIVNWDDWHRPQKPTPSRFPSGYSDQPEPPAENTCACGCGRVLGVLRRDGKYWSNACRQRAYRDRSRYTDPNAVNLDVTEAVTDATDENPSQTDCYRQFQNSTEDSGEVPFVVCSSEVVVSSSEIVKDSRASARARETPDSPTTGHPHPA